MGAFETTIFSGKRGGVGVIDHTIGKSGVGSL